MGVSIRTLQRVDRRFGPIAGAVLQPLRLMPRRAPSEVRRLVVVKFWGIGSITLLGPAVRVLRRRFPSAAIDLLTLEANAPYARRLGAFDDVVALDLGDTWRTTAFGIARMLRQVRVRRYDRLYDFEFLTHFSAIVARLSRARWTVGFSAPEVWRGGFFDETVPFNRYWHVARNARSLAGGENGEDVKFDELIRPASTEAGREEARRCLADGPVPSARPLVVVNPNAGELALERRWPPTRFAALLNGLLGLTDAAERLSIAPDSVRVVLIGSQDERAYVEDLRQRTRAPERIENLAGRLSFDGLVALLEGAALLVSNDSGPLQVGAALGRPVVALFGPETPVMYAPLGERATVLYRPPACSPCINVHDNKMATCHVGHALCMESIEADEVLAAAARTLTPALSTARSRAGRLDR